MVVDRDLQANKEVELPAETAESQLADIVRASGHLIPEQYAQAGRVIQGHPELREKMFRALNMEVARAVIVPSQYLSEAEMADQSLTNEDKTRLAFRRFGEISGDQLRLLQQSGQYSEQKIEGFLQNVATKISWGGDARSIFVIDAVAALGVPEDTQTRIIARHLVDRALDRYEFKRTGDEDVQVTRERLGDQYDELMREAMVAIINKRSTPEYRKGGLWKQGETPVGNMMKDFRNSVNTLGLSPDSIQAIEVKAAEVLA